MSYENIFPIRAYAWANAIREAGICLNIFADAIRPPDDRDRMIIASGEVRRALGRLLPDLDVTRTRLRVSLPEIGTNDLDAYPRFEVYGGTLDGRGLPLLHSWAFPQVPDDLANAIQFELSWTIWDHKGRKTRGNNPIPLV